MFRWADLAWSGALPDGRVMVAFHESEGRLPGDRMAFAPADVTAFQATLGRVVASCRGVAADEDRVLSSHFEYSRSCYFARYPGIELVEATQPQGEPARAVVTVLAQETPDAELRLLVERSASGDGWAEPEIAFTISGLGSGSFPVGAARFTLDGVPIDPPHNIAVYNGTRLRIRLASSSGERDDSFYHRLSSSLRAAVTLIDSAGTARAEFTFATGPALAAARRSLDAAGWSCAAAAPAPTPAAQWQVAK